MESKGNFHVVTSFEGKEEVEVCGKYERDVFKKLEELNGKSKVDNPILIVRIYYLTLNDAKVKYHLTHNLRNKLLLVRS